MAYYYDLGRKICTWPYKVSYYRGVSYPQTSVRFQK